MVIGTSSDANIAAFDHMFSRHGYCNILLTDNDPPFNGSGSHDLQQYLKWARIKHQPSRSAEDPEATGLMETFTKQHIKKVWDTAITKHSNQHAEFNKHLLMFEVHLIQPYTYPLLKYFLAGTSAHDYHSCPLTQQIEPRWIQQFSMTKSARTSKSNTKIHSHM